MTNEDRTAGQARPSIMDSRELELIDWLEEHEDELFRDDETPPQPESAAHTSQQCPIGQKDHP